MTNLLALAEKVEKGVLLAIESIYEQDPKRAKRVIEEDQFVDQKEVEIEEDCLKILALHQPVAEDLRVIAAIMKINNDLERMGDGSVGIAKRVLHITKKDPIPVPKDLRKMTDAVIEMVQKSLNAFVNKDTDVARLICSADDEVDVLNRKILKELRQQMKDSPEQIDAILDVFSTVRRLERIADLATNVAEDVIYMVEGEIVRHLRDDDIH